MKTTLPDYLTSLNEEEIKVDSLCRLKNRFKTFDKFSHKGTRGHAAIFAGSHGMMGAAILALKSANRSGVGKVTAIIHNEYFALIHAQSPESLIEENKAEEINFDKFNSIGVGPGLGAALLTHSMIDCIISSGKPLVLDADALNFLSKNKQYLKKIPPESILTPHLREWERLLGPVDNDKIRIEKTIEICKELNINVVIKGHFSCLVTSKGSFFFNGTGNAGMAKAGSGDVLTGLITGLLAQGYTSEDAALIGMYIHGLSGDLAKEALGEEAMIASDQIHFFSNAFLKLRDNILNLP